MPDTRKHRGPHPADLRLFGPRRQPDLRQAVEHLSWLLTRGYALESSLKLVGDRFRLTERQRKGVARSACSDQALDSRRKRLVSFDHLRGQPVEIDGFNLLTTIEAALAGGVVLRGRDGCFRDMASMHGSYRKVEETRPALHLVGRTLCEAGVAEAVWYLDRPVSNSGRLSQIIEEIAHENGWNWTARLAADPDRLLVRSRAIVVSADSQILDRCARWTNLAAEIVVRHIPKARLVEMAPPADAAADPT